VRLRRDPSADVPTDTEDATDDETELGRKNRPTPKRRDAEGRRGPVTAPKTRKEAYARQKQQAREARSNRTAPTSVKPTSAAERRAALRRGDPSALPRRDQGATRKIARDWVDGTRMLSNYLLWLFPIYIIVTLVPVLRVAAAAIVVVFLGLIVESYFAARKVRALALERNGKAEGGTFGLAFYMLGRAYMPRRWRIPHPQVQRGEQF
jgi:hypothetical protein